VYQWHETGTPLSFYTSQRDWQQTRGAMDFARLFWFGNPWQHFTFGGVAHEVYWFILFGASLSLMREDLPLGLYALLSTLVVTAQGELVMMFRFGAVIFPLQFSIGRRLQSAPKWARCAALGVCATFNLIWTAKYAMGGFSY
jgi:hypothetical protein